MVATLLLMGASTFSIGCLPTYHQVGRLTPALLVTLRILQGLSASGEQAGANSMSFEHAPFGQRGYYTSYTLSGTQGGQVIAPAIVLPLAALLSDQQFDTWEWRIPFWFSAVVVLVGYMVRRTLEETPAFDSEERHGEVPAVPLAILFRNHWRPLLQVFFAALISTVSTTFTVFALAFATDDTYKNNLSKTLMLWLAIIANLIAAIIIPFLGALSDRIGRKKVFITGDALCAVLIFAFLWSITTRNSAFVFATGIVLAGFAYSLTNAVWPATYAERFPTQVRLSGMAVATQFGFALGGLAAIIEALIGGNGPSAWLPVAIYASAACVVSAVSVATMRETYRVPLEDLGTDRARPLPPPGGRPDRSLPKHGPSPRQSPA